MGEAPFNATVVARRDLNPRLCILRVRPDGALPAFEPGQHILLGLPREGQDGLHPDSGGRRARLLRRAYSIASANRGEEALEFFVVRIEHGRLTPRLWPLEIGGRLWVADRAQGELTLAATPPDRDLVLVATGTGIAPFISMLRSYRGAGRWRRFTLIHGVREVSDLGYREELEAAQRDNPSVRYLPVVSRAPEGQAWNGLRGRVQQVLDPQRFLQQAGAPLDPGQCTVFLCGNPAMIRDVEALLRPLGFRRGDARCPGNLHYERYW